MNFYKMGVALSFVTAIGFVACDDSSSTKDKDSNDPNVIHCTVTNETDPFTTEMTKGDLSATTTIKNNDGKMTMVVEFNKDVPASECDSYTEKYSEHMAVECKGKTITAKTEDKVNDAFMDIITDMAKAECTDMDGKKIDKEDVEKAKDEAEDLLKCDTEGETKEVDVGGLGVKVLATCTKGVWVPDEEAMEQFKCSAEEEGQTKKIGELPFICEDGEWIADLDLGDDTGSSEGEGESEGEGDSESDNPDEATASDEGSAA